jgi:hypothetical protein
MANPVVPLSMLLTRDVPYEWHDGVALMAQLVGQLRSNSGGQEPTEIPDLRSVALDQMGWLTISPHPEQRLPIMPGGAQLLQQLLSGKDQPPQLRLFAMQSATADPVLPVGIFADELGKWERPNRIPKLVALYSRAVEHIGTQALSDEARAREQRLEEERVRAVSETPSASNRPPLKLKKPGSSPRTVIAGLAIVAAALGVAALEWRYVMARFSSQPTVTLDIEAEAEPEPPAPRPAARPITSPSPPPAAVVAAPETTTRPAAVPEEIVRAEMDLAQGQEFFAQQDYARARLAFERVLDALRNEQSPHAEDIRQAARQLEEVTRAALAEAAVTSGVEYRNGDAGVTPPVPQSFLPPKPNPRTPPDQLQVLELRINADGQVDSAKFVMNRPTYRNAWWPAAAKAWRFRPATKNGRPVRYVMRIVMDDSAP